MSMISVTNLTFAYEGSYDNIFENVSLRLDTNWRLGFIGRNGRGKTTFLNLLLGKYRYSGAISAAANFEYFPYQIDDSGKKTLDIINSIYDDYQEWELSYELNQLNIDEEVLDRAFATLSQGERSKVLLAALFLKPNSFLLIDEPTNHLDREARELVSKYLRRKSGFILVSHDRAFLDNCIDHILVINNTNIEVQKGNFSSWWENKQRQDHFELAENEKLQSEIKHLQAAAKRTNKWSDDIEKGKFGQRNSGSKVDKGYIGHQAAKMMKTAKVIEKRQQQSMEKKSQLLKNIETADVLKLIPAKHHSSRLLEANDLSLFYDDKQVISRLSFTLDQGERLAICGKNGSGKSTLLKLIIGEDISYSGSFIRSSWLTISYVSQDTSWLQGNLSDFADKQQLDESVFKAMLRKMAFPRLQFEKDIASFSSGQKKKVLLAKSICEQAHLYVWDEPLNFIDVLSRIQIEELLLSYCPTMVFVEHDKSFSDNIATKTINL